MKARDVMVAPVITAKPYFTVQHVAKLLVQHHISALPVVDDKNHVVGMISEGDLLHRAETHTERRRRSWWLTLLSSETSLARDYIKERAKKIADLMTTNVVSATPETPLSQIAMLIEQNGIKRIPVVVQGKLVGIVSRANLVQALAAVPLGLDIQPGDEKIRDDLMSHLSAQKWAHTEFLNVTVNDGVVHLWGLAGSETERKAIRIAAESFKGVRAVNDHMLPKEPASYA